MLQALDRWFSAFSAQSRRQARAAFVLQRRDQLIAVLHRQLEQELSSDYDVKVGMRAIGDAGQVMRAAAEAAPDDPDRYAREVATALFALLCQFQTHGPRGDYSSAASTLSSLLFRLEAELGGDWPALRRALIAGWRALE